MYISVSIKLYVGGRDKFICKTPYESTGDHHRLFPHGLPSKSVCLCTHSAVRAHGPQILVIPNHKNKRSDMTPAEFSSAK